MADGQTGRLGDVEVELVDVRRRADLLSATVRYRAGARTWAQAFTARRLTDGDLHRELAGAGLRLDGWLSEEHTWFAASPAR